MIEERALASESVAALIPDASPETLDRCIKALAAIERVRGWLRAEEDNNALYGTRKERTEL